ncbi:MAG: hypothetical protein GY928_03880 [Colwellia sp.]|nr:hypothetical protein [Colwellia sp.]
MKKLSIIITISLSVAAFTNSAFATRYWPPVLTDWSLSLNNGVAYISSPQFAEHCSYDRGQINMDGTEFNKAQYAYAMSAKAKGKKLQYVVDDTQTTCIITGLQEVD